MTEDHTANTGDAPTPTTAQRLAQRAHELLELRDDENFADLLSDGFVHEPRLGEGFRFDRDHMMGTVHAAREFGMHISGTAVAVAGDNCVLTRRAYQQGARSSQLLAISMWSDNGKLERLIEFDADDLDAALEALAEVSDDPVIVLETGER
jgi:hypothetical protein